MTARLIKIKIIALLYVSLLGLRGFSQSIDFTKTTYLTYFDKNKFGYLKINGYQIDTITKCNYYQHDIVNAPHNLVFDGLNWFDMTNPEKPKQVQYNIYLGRGIFATKNKNKYDVFSFIENKLIASDFDTVYPYDITKDYFPHYEIKSIGIKDKIIYGLTINSKLTYLTKKPSELYITNKDFTISYGIKTKLTDSTEKTLIPFEYDDIEARGSYFYCRKGKNYKIFDHLFNQIGVSEEIPSELKNDQLIVKQKGKYGVINLKGIQILRCDFSSINFDFASDNIYPVYVCQKENEFILYNGKWETLYVSKAEKCFINYFEFHSPLIEIYEEVKGNIVKQYLIHSETKSKLAYSSFEEIKSITNTKKDNLLLVKNKDNLKYGIINIDSNIILPALYDAITPLQLKQDAKTIENGKYLIKKNDTYAFMNMDFKIDNDFWFNQYSEALGAENFSYMVIRKENKWYLYNYFRKKILHENLDSISSDKVELYMSYKNQHRYSYGLPRILKNNQSYLIDTSGKIFYDFKNIRVKQNGGYVILEDTVLNKTPLNILPLASINRCEEINKQEQYALVYCLNKYFVVNKYAEMIPLTSEIKPEKIFLKSSSYFGLKKKKSKLPALYNFKGDELGKISKYVHSELVDNYNSIDYYIRIYDKNEKQGLVNSKGELVLDCIYDNISNVMNNECEVDLNGKLKTINVTTLKPLTWGN